MDSVTRLAVDSAGVFRSWAAIKPEVSSRQLLSRAYGPSLGTDEDRNSWMRRLPLDMSSNCGLRIRPGQFKKLGVLHGFLTF